MLRPSFSVAASLLLQAGLLAGFIVQPGSRLSAQAPRPTAPRASARLTLGEFIVDPPTLINLGFEWLIDGDDNRNGAVAVAYRRKGTTVWQEALPLLRVQHERIQNGDQLDVIAPNMFAGSVLDLEPDTEYEVRFTASDPDGVTGVAQTPGAPTAEVPGPTGGTPAER